MIITEAYREVDKVVIAHDGSAACARALQWFIQLNPFGKDIEVHVVHVCDTDNETITDKSKLLLHLVSNYLKTHNFNNITTRLVDQGNTGDRIISYIRETGVDMIIMGAHSMSALRRLTIGSTTHDLVKNSPVPLFVSQ
jgi:nucleotide-binding universal stress UspA family protein